MATSALLRKFATPLLLVLAATFSFAAGTHQRRSRLPSPAFALSPAIGLRAPARSACTVPVATTCSRQLQRTSRAPLISLQASSTSPSAVPPEETQEQLLAELVGVEDKDERMKALRKMHPLLNNEGLSLVLQRAESEGGAWAEVLEGLQKMTEEAMERGKGTLEELLKSGEINVLDRKIVEGVKKGGIDPAFVQVLEMNIAAAEEGGSGSEMSLQILSHIYTRVQEEMEKVVDPAVGLLHRLLRQVEQPGIRNNILEKYLKPKPEDEWEMTFVDGDMVTDFGADVDPLKLSAAMSTYLGRIRDEGFDEDVVGQTYADCRVIAKDARVWVEQFYDEEMLDDYTESLTPVFQPVLKTLEKYERPPAPPEDDE